MSERELVEWAQREVVTTDYREPHCIEDLREVTLQERSMQYSDTFAGPDLRPPVRILITRADGCSSNRAFARAVYVRTFQDIHVGRTTETLSGLIV
jgi:hypothetical protein